MTNPLPRDEPNSAELNVSSKQHQTSLSDCVTRALQDYFKQLNGHPAANLHEMLMTEVEVPLLQTTLQHTEGNQSHAAKILGINRATLRKKLKHYGLS